MLTVEFWGVGGSGSDLSLQATPRATPTGPGRSHAAQDGRHKTSWAREGCGCPVRAGGRHQLRTDLEGLHGPAAEGFLLSTELIPFPCGGELSGPQMGQLLVDVVSKGAELRVHAGAEAKHGIPARGRHTWGVWGGPSHTGIMWHRRPQTLPPQRGAGPASARPRLVLPNSRALSPTPVTNPMLGLQTYESDTR